MSATMASFTSRTLNRASAEQSRTSQAVIRSTPPPTHHPAIAATTGLRHDATQVIARCRRSMVARNSVRSLASASPMTLPSSPPIVARSSPYEKCSPSPRSSTERTSASASSQPNASGISRQNAGPMRLAFPEARRVTVAT